MSIDKVQEYLNLGCGLACNLTTNSEPLSVTDSILMAQMYQREAHHKELIEQLPYGLLSEILLELKSK